MLCPVPWVPLITPIPQAELERMHAERRARRRERKAAR